MINLKDVKPINLNGVKVRLNRIYRVGVELEGGWDKSPDPQFRLEHDGSVQGTNALFAAGELPSPPMEVDKIEAWIRKFYPDRVNETCGMHVHLSVKSALTYQRLMRPEYPKTIIEEFKKWSKENLPANHCIFDRLAGKSIYCRHVFSADDQVMNVEKDHNRDRRGNRYTVVNYCWGRHQTAECRLLPMMPDVDTSVRAVQELIDITNKFLCATAEKERKLRGEALLNDRGAKEVRDVRVRL